MKKGRERVRKSKTKKEPTKDREEEKKNND